MESRRVSTACFGLSGTHSRRCWVSSRNSSCVTIASNASSEARSSGKCSSPSPHIGAPRGGGARPATGLISGRISVPRTAVPLGKKLLVAHEHGALFITRQRRVFRIAAFRYYGHPPHFFAALRGEIAAVFGDGGGTGKYRNQNTRC